MGVTLQWSPAVETALYLTYRIAAYVVVNLGEDAALVAFMFC